MSEANVAQVRRAFDAFNARDVDLLLTLCDPDTEWLPFRAQLEGTTYRGHEGVRSFVADMDSDWRSFRIDPSDFRDSGSRVVVIGHIHGVGGATGVEIDTVGGFVFECHSGLITRVVSHSDPAAALAELR